MAGLVQRTVPSIHNWDYSNTFPSYPSGQIVHHPHGIILPQQKNKNQNNYEITSISFFFISNDPLSILKTESPQERAFSSCVNDGIKRYKLVNNTDSYDPAPAKLFLLMLKLLSNTTMPRITFYTDAVKARIAYKQKEFIIDYDYEEPEAVFVSTFEGDKLLVKDGPVKNLFQILESF